MKEKMKVESKEAVPYDERSSCYVNYGVDHGVGYKQPVGSSKEAKQHVPAMPMSSSMKKAK